MSTARVRDALGGDRWPSVTGDASAADAAALASVAVAAGAYLSVLYGVVTVVGGAGRLLLVVAAAVGLAAVLRALPWKLAVALAAVLLGGGLALYLQTVPPAYLAVMSPTRVVQDTVALLTGFSVLRMPAAGAWAVAVAPAPTFLVAYLAFRTRYALAAGLAGLTLGFFVLTGDAGTATTLVGVLAAAGAVGFGTLARHRAGRRQTEVLAVVLAFMVLAPAAVTAVPGGQSPLVPSSSTAPSGSLVSAGGYVGVGGSIQLDPHVQFVVESERETYWRAGVYDRFTGNGWVRTSGVGAAENTPPPTGERYTQRVTAKRTLDVLPVGTTPLDVDGTDATLTEGGVVASSQTLYEGDSYRVTSRALGADRSVLVNETGRVPDAIANRYLQTPDSTSQQVVDLADRITADMESNYAKAAAVERWLEANKRYSLDAADPSGDLVNAFVLGDGPGYCTYYASSMAVMLRSQGVPTRYVVGYTPGQRVSEDTWVVRGLDSHAWVEVYVPDRGWVRFDPTPGNSRESVEDARLQNARQSGVEGIEAAGSEDGTWTPTTTTTTTTTDTGTGTTTTTQRSAPTAKSAYGADRFEEQVAGVANITAPTAPGGGGGDVGGGSSLPPLSTLAVWGVLAVGLGAGLRYTGAAERAYRSLWLRWLPRGDPGEEVEGAFERVEYVLERRYRERRPGETVREYLADVRASDRARRVADIRERARYAGEVDAEDAAEAKRLARSLAAEISRLPGLRRGDSV